MVSMRPLRSADSIAVTSRGKDAPVKNTKLRKLKLTTETVRIIAEGELCGVKGGLTRLPPPETLATNCEV